MHLLAHIGHAGEVSAQGQAPAFLAALAQAFAAIATPPPVAPSDSGLRSVSFSFGSACCVAGCSPAPAARPAAAPAPAAAGAPATAPLAAEVQSTALALVGAPQAAAGHPASRTCGDSLSGCAAGKSRISGRAKQRSSRLESFEL